MIADDARRRPAREGVDVVYGVRTDRSTDSVFKRGSARAFYRLIRRRQRHRARRRDAGDFRLMSPRHRRRGQRACPSTTGCCGFVVPALGFPSRRGALPARRARGRQLQVPAGQDDAALGRQRHRLLHRSPARWPPGSACAAASPRSSCWSTRCVAALTATPLPGWTSTVVAVAAVGAVQLLCLGHPRRVRRPDVHPDAGPAVLLRGLRLADRGRSRTTSRHEQRHAGQSRAPAGSARR